MKKITPARFTELKKQLRFHRARTVSEKHDLHISTVLNVKGCRNFGEYRELVKAEHMPIKYSLAEEVYDLHRRLYEKPNQAYIRPRNSKQAMLEINKTV